jgi:diguanylate cyclase (GGDEF)-like protein
MLWRAGAGVLALTAVSGVIEGFAARGSIGLVVASTTFPVIGAGLAATLGPRMRPAASFRVGQLFLTLATLSAALAVYTWRGTMVGGAMSLDFVMVMLFAAVFFDRRDVHLQLTGIGAVLAGALLVDGPSLIVLLVWTTTMLPVAATGIVLSRMVERMRAQSYRDALTGAANRRAWEAALAEAVVDHRRRRRPLSVLLVDIDHFKLINDRAGHDGGDEVLRRAVTLWRPLVRASDVVARLGGDEFALLLPACGLEAASHIASLLVALVREGAGVTCSVGVATAVDDGDASSLLAVADRQLYAAKDAGRACVRGALVGDPSPNVTTAT